MRLKDKVVVVTGSCTGIGKAILRRCVSEGASVIVHGLQTSLGESLVDELGADRSRVADRRLDQRRRPGKAGRICRSKSLGRLDAIVNNAAMIATGTIQDTSRRALQ